MIYIDVALTSLLVKSDDSVYIDKAKVIEVKKQTEEKQTAKVQTVYFTGPLGNDVFQCSPMPWVTYTHISHTNSGKKDNATPLFDWGKYYEKDGRIMIPISVQAHHSFVDGVHIGQFVEELKRLLNEC